MIKIITLCSLAWLIPLVSISQVAGEEEGWEEILESILPLSQEETNQEEVYDNLNHIRDNPVDLNRADKERLGALYFLTDQQIDSLLAYRDRHGPLLSVKELLWISGFDAHTLRMVSPFITIQLYSDSRGGGLLHWIADGRKSMMTRYSRLLEEPVWYLPQTGKNNRYLGNRDRINGRYKISHENRFSVGFAFDKDAGEPIVWSPRKNYFGFDHYSYHLSVADLGHIKNLTLGDFKIQFGQGLVIGNGFYPGKSSETIAAINSRDTGTRPYNGSGESGFFRGAALTLDLGHFETCGFISAKKVDSRLEKPDSSGTEDDIIRSIINTGLHRSWNEIDSRKNSLQIAAGSHVNYKNRKKDLSLGATLVYTHFNHYWSAEPEYYNQFDFRGKELMTTGIDFRYSHRKFSAFAESAVSGSRGWGLVSGIIGNLSKNIETAIHIRYLSRSFQSFYGNPFREAAKVVNEEGIYWGLKFMPFKCWTLNLYLDSYRFPWLKFNLRSPSAGKEIFSRLSWNPSENLGGYFQFLQRTMEVSLPGNGPGIPGLEAGVKNQYVIQFNKKFSNGFQLKSRFQGSTYLFNGRLSHGRAWFQEIGWDSKNIDLNIRLVQFNTDDYQNRQYIFEPSALYDFQVPLLNGQGIRLSLLASARVNRRLHLWFKTGRTWYKNISVTGSGLDAIPGNHKTEFLAQAEYKF